jgi:hypothetical protein
MNLYEQPIFMYMSLVGKLVSMYQIYQITPPYKTTQKMDLIFNPQQPSYHSSSFDKLYWYGIYLSALNKHCIVASFLLTF